MAPSDSLRVSVFGLPYFADRAVDLLNALGHEAWRVPPRPPRTLRTAIREVQAALEQLGSAVRSDVIIVVGGPRRLGLVLRLAAILGTVVVVQWVGSDVLHNRKTANNFVRTGVHSWTDAPWLREELHAAGFRHIRVLPLNDTSVPDPPSPLPSQFTVLTYVPDSRQDFYGRDRVVSVAKRFPQIRFLMAASERAVPDVPNLEPCGWIDDVPSALDNVTVVLRQTRHDGLSHLVLEALAAGRYAIWNYPLTGAALASSPEEIEHILSDWLQRHGRGALSLNEAGRRAVKEEYDREQVLCRLETELRRLFPPEAEDPRARITVAISSWIREILLSLTHAPHRRSARR